MLLLLLWRGRTWRRRRIVAGLPALGDVGRLFGVGHGEGGGDGCCEVRWSVIVVVGRSEELSCGC